MIDLTLFAASATEVATDAYAQRSLIERITADPAMALLTIGLLVAASWQVLISRDTARRELRAYVTVQTAGALRMGSTLHFQCTAINAGQTPARNLICGAKFLLVEPSRVGEIPRWQFENLDAKGAPWGPGQEVLPLLEERVLSEDEASAVEEGRLLVYVIGQYRYEDIFKKIQTTDMRYELETNASGRAILYPHNGGGNDAT